MKNETREALLEFVGESVETFLVSLPFKSPQEIRNALTLLAEEIESLDEDDLFDKLDNVDLEEGYATVEND